MTIASGAVPEKRAGKRIAKVKKKKRDPVPRRMDGKKDGRFIEKPENVERRKQAMELRASGLKYIDIARQLGYYDPSAARKDVVKGLEQMEIDTAKEIIAMDIANLDEFKMRCLHSLRTNGDLHQIDRIMRVMEMKYRLLGISDETVRSLQQEHGITVNVGGSTHNVMVVQAASETEKEFIEKMMSAVGVDPNSKKGKKWIQENLDAGDRTLPMLEGGANSDLDAIKGAAKLEDEDIVEAELVEEDE